VAARAIRQRRRPQPQLSLGMLLVVTAFAGSAVLSGVHWHQTAGALVRARADYTAAVFRFHSASSDEKPAHPVTLTQPFYMGKYAVTQEQFKAVTGETPSHFKGVNNPVDSVSWEDAQEFCKRLTKAKQTVRLPTEAEWEYSCRAGTTTTYYSGDTGADLARSAWFYWNSNSTTHPVGQKEPNAFRLYDMHGNVWQWCHDWYTEDYYGKSPDTDPEGAAQGAFRLLRGGSRNGFPFDCRSAGRGRYEPGEVRHSLGFRIVMPASTSP
jgi:formylglycine-generating enzyme required for sulfatase activity